METPIDVQNVQETSHEVVPILYNNPTDVQNVQKNVLRCLHCRLETAKRAETA